MLTIYIGFDPREEVAFHTLVSSIIHNASRPVRIVPLHENLLGSVYSRELSGNESNSFSYSRFLVPHLNDYTGYAIYMDCDMLLTSDIFEVLNELDRSRHAVAVVQHDYRPKSNKKYLGAVQHAYPRKNWSSFVVWNCGHHENAIVTPDFVSKSTPATLHRFAWLSDESIGQLDMSWNFLVGEYDKPDFLPKNIHWTLGGPYFNEYQTSDFSAEWADQFGCVKHADQLDES